MDMTDGNIKKTLFRFALPMVLSLITQQLLQFSCLAYLFYGWKIINESVLRGFMRMKEYLYSNLSDLIVKIVMTYLLVSKFSLNGFWIGNMLGKVVAFIICMFGIRHNHLLKKDYAE